MSRTYVWSEHNRVQLGETLPEALVLVPVGAIEQHGPHLAVGTDTLIVNSLVANAAKRAAPASPRDLIITPTISFGASDHHFEFGATLSLTVETMTSVLIDLARSVALSGGRRLLLVNGHGGNRGPCHSASLAASTRFGLVAGYLDYWELLLGAEQDPGAPPIPGHAGAFETSILSHLRPELVTPSSRPGAPPVPAVTNVHLHTQQTWQRLNGHTDDPSEASETAGRTWFETCVRELALRIRSIAEAS